MNLIWNQPLGDLECPYAYRWSLDFGRLGSIRLHHWHSSDDKRAQHDHPSDFVTLVLKGGYTDESDRHERMRPWTIRRRRAEHVHTVVVDPGGCWTLLYFFPERREWGFHVPRKNDTVRFMPARKYFYKYGHHPCDQE